MNNFALCSAPYSTLQRENRRRGRLPVAPGAACPAPCLCGLPARCCEVLQGARQACQQRPPSAKHPPCCCFHLQYLGTGGRGRGSSSGSGNGSGSRSGGGGGSAPLSGGGGWRGNEAHPWLLPERAGNMPYSGVSHEETLLRMRSGKAAGRDKAISVFFFSTGYAALAENHGELARCQTEQNLFRGCVPLHPRPALRSAAWRGAAGAAGARYAGGWKRALGLRERAAEWAYVAACRTVCQREGLRLSSQLPAAHQKMGRE